jgi:uncharacterized protein (TIGR02231 family)
MMFTDRQRLFVAVTLMVFFICLWITPRPASAAVKEVTLFPESAKIEETLKIGPQAANKNQVIIVLPPLADTESLVVSPPSAGRLKIDDIQVKPVTRLDEDRIAQLRAQLKKAQSERKEMQAKLKALDVQLLFWQAQTKAKTKTVADADNLAAAIGRNSRKIYSEKNTIETDLEKIEKQIKELQDGLNQAAGRAEKAWEATVTLSGNIPGDTVLSYSYMMGGCGWQPLYRLEAMPGTGSIVFSWDAEVWQSSGEDWSQVQMHLATLQPVRTISPRELPPWIIKPRTPVLYRSAPQPRAAMKKLQKEADADEAFAEAAPAPAPSETTHTTYSSWALGKKTLSAGSRQRLKISEETWPAQFLILARPSLSNQAFLQASLKLSRPVEIPNGQASFLIDGALIGKRPFALAGSEAEIYFGNSPFISVSTVTVADKSGEKRVFQNKQTRQWLWRIEAKNNGNAPARLRIEEPVPQARDERIELTFKHSPEPTEKDSNRFVWEIDLPAMQKKTIETGVELTAPRDLTIDFGWRN